MSTLYTYIAYGIHQLDVFSAGMINFRIIINELTTTNVTHFTESASQYVALYVLAQFIPTVCPS